MYHLSLFVVGLQLLFIVLFGVFVRYNSQLGVPLTHDNVTHSLSDSEQQQQHDGRDTSLNAAAVRQSYPLFQDIHVMVFIGFGFLMTFLKRYGFSSVGLNMLIAAVVLQWATLTAGWLLHMHDRGATIHITIHDIIGAEFAAAAVLISFGAVLGKVSAVQLLLMAIIEVLLFQLNQLIVFNKLQASDIGDSMVVHLFGAYFGLMVSRVLHKADDLQQCAHAKQRSVYHSDLFAMIGTIFLWLFWPSFNSAAAVGEGQYRAVVNTYFALAACVVVAFAVSALVCQGKFDMVHVQNATLAGGVAVGTMADMIIQPWAALLIGSIAATISVLGYRYITPFLASRLGIHDTCGVHNLHGLPGVLSGLGGIVCAGAATTQLYGHTLTVQFPARDRLSAGQQAGHQAAALVISLAISVVGGLATGMLLRLHVWEQPTSQQLFDDTSYWTLPDEGFPSCPAVIEEERQQEHKEKRQPPVDNV